MPLGYVHCYNQDIKVSSLLWHHPLVFPYSLSFGWVCSNKVLCACNISFFLISSICVLHSLQTDSKKHLAAYLFRLSPCTSYTSNVLSLCFLSVFNYLIHPLVNSLIWVLKCKQIQTGQRRIIQH